MAKDLHSYFTAKENQSQVAIPEFVTSLSGNVSQGELTLVSEELKKTSKFRKHYNKYFLFKHYGTSYFVAFEKKIIKFYLVSFLTVE